jgi:CheY-like chemotaxis protein
MVVEDNELNMKLVRTLLTMENCEVIELPNAESVVERATHETPDLILMDIQLPGISGLDACAQLKADSRTTRIPIIALTSYAMPGDEEKALSVGCADYITKPIDTANFARTVCEHI